MKEYKPSKKTLEKVMSYLDKTLHYPLSTDDALYLRWKIQNELFQRNYEHLEKVLFEEWSNKYQYKFDGNLIYKGQLVRR